MHVVPEQGTVYHPETYRTTVAESLSKASCTLHILGEDYSPLLPDAPGTSLVRYQFFEAKKALAEKPGFKVFVWNPVLKEGLAIDEMQNAFLKEVRNNIVKNMVFSNVSSPIQLVEDMRSITEIEEQAVFKLNATDIFFICNQLDEKEASEIADLLSDIIPVERLSIVQDSEVDYSALCQQQIGKSKLAVVYFKESADWAIPFVQQVWKKIGGASSHVPILLIGDEEPDSNTTKIFKAPKVLSLVVAGELIPLEIKIEFDRIMEEGA